MPHGQRAKTRPVRRSKLMLANDAVGERALAAHEHVGGTTGELDALETGVLGVAGEVVLGDGPSLVGVEGQ